MALLLRVVVGESDRGEVELGVLEQLPQNHVSGGAGAHDQCTLAGSRAGVLLPRSQRPDEQARGAHDCAAQERVGRHHNLVPVFLSRATKAPLALSSSR